MDGRRECRRNRWMGKRLTFIRNEAIFVLLLTALLQYRLQFRLFQALT